MAKELHWSRCRRNNTTQKYMESNLFVDRLTRNLFAHVCPLSAIKLLLSHPMLPGLSQKQHLVIPEIMCTWFIKIIHIQNLSLYRFFFNGGNVIESAAKILIYCGVFAPCKNGWATETAVLSNTCTNNETMGLCNPLLGSSSVNALPHRRNDVTLQKYLAITWLVSCMVCTMQQRNCVFCVVHATAI
jgi:hypothetical protein